MVSSTEIQGSNTLINDVTGPRVAVFAGGTSGIGKYTIKALVATGTSVRIYLIGRKGSKEGAEAFIQELHAINPKAEVVWTEGEISLLAETKRVCEVIKSKESRIDLLFLTAGYAPMGTRTETTEGLEITQALEYYSRMLFVLHLLPLLNKVENPRVVSVLAGGLERANAINLDDIGLKKPGNFGLINGQTQFGALNTVTLEKLADDNPHVTFIHSWPGWVSTGNARRGLEKNPIIAWLVSLFLEPFIRIFAISDESSGQRYLFQCTSAVYGSRGVPWKGEPGLNTRGKQEGGLFLVDYKCNHSTNAKVVPVLREKARDQVWKHTQDVFRPYE
jgi:NAD(P)-dependent dehydrogenase (short-subunit alcohol dehydrogenase family)